MLCQVFAHVQAGLPIVQACCQVQFASPDCHCPCAGQILRIHYTMISIIIINNLRQHRQSVSVFSPYCSDQAVPQYYCKCYATMC